MVRRSSHSWSCPKKRGSKLPIARVRIGRNRGKGPLLRTFVDIAALRVGPTPHSCLISDEQL